MDTVTNLFFGASNDTMSQDIDILPMPTNPFDDVTIVPLADWSTTVTPMRNMPKSMGHLTCISSTSTRPVKQSTKH